ncbi:MAG TPA: DUF998 domain-containing protein [Candidatus Lokiarchaeia archaeon]|nr:DUF998 domain-containing protein [Candidatus Lokiarchaeia archaeon]
MPETSLHSPVHFLISGICGVLAVIVSPLNYTIVALVQPNYSLFNQSISELGSTGAPFGTYISTCFFLSGLFEMTCASGLYPALSRTKHALWGSILIAMAGFFNSTCSGLFPLDPGYSGMLHDATSIIGEVAMIFAPFVLLPAMKSNQEWKGVGKITLIVGIAFLVIVALTPFAGIYNAGEGFVQRIGDFAYYFWLFCIAMKFFRTYKNSIVVINAKGPPNDVNVNE